MPALTVRNEIKEVFGFDWSFPQDVARKVQDEFKPTMSQVQRTSRDQIPATRKTPIARYTEPTLWSSPQLPIPALLKPQLGQDESQRVPKIVQKAESIQPITAEKFPNVLSDTFGSSPSDIVMIVAFAKALYGKCRDAGREYDEISKEIRGLHTVLTHLKYEVEAAESALNRDQSLWGRELAAIIWNSDFTLRQIDSMIMEYGRLNKVQSGSNKLNQLGGFRIKLISHKTSLRSFLDAIQIQQPEKLTTNLDNNGGQLDLILDKVDAMASRMATSNQAHSRSSHENEDKEQWRRFRRELVAEGFSADVLQKHKVIAKTTKLYQEITNGGFQDVLRAYIRETNQIRPLDEIPQASGELESEVTSTSSIVARDFPRRPMLRVAASYSIDSDSDSDESALTERSENWQSSVSIIQTTDLQLREIFPPSDIHQTRLDFSPANSADSGYASKGSLSASNYFPRLVATVIAPDEFGRDIPPDAKWTKIRRTLVDPQVLEEDYRRYET